MFMRLMLVGVWREREREERGERGKNKSFF